MRRLLALALLMVAGLGVHTVLVHGEDPLWAHGLGGLVTTGFAMVGLGLVVVVREPQVRRLALRLERACGCRGEDGRMVSWVLYGFGAMLALGAMGVFGWVRGFCAERSGGRDIGVEGTVEAMHTRHGARGLTVLELVFTILILLVLLSFLLVGLDRFRESARRGVAQVTIRSLYVAMDGYQLDHGAWPTRTGVDDVHITYDADAEPLTRSDRTLNLLSPHYRFGSGDLEWGDVPCLRDPWGVPYFFQVFDPASHEAGERAAGEWWQARHLSHPVKIYSVGSEGNRAEAAHPLAEGGGYWVSFEGGTGTGGGVLYAHELED